MEIPVYTVKVASKKSIEVIPSRSTVNPDPSLPDGVVTQKSIVNAVNYALKERGKNLEEIKGDDTLVEVQDKINGIVKSLK